LEQLGTALVVTSTSPTKDQADRVERLQAIEAHIILEEAREALRRVDEMTEAATEWLLA